VAAPLLDRAVRGADLLGRRALGGFELLPHEHAVLVRTTREGRRVRPERLVLELRPGIGRRLGHARLDDTGSEALEGFHPCLGRVRALRLAPVSDPRRLPQQTDRETRKAWLRDRP